MHYSFINLGNGPNGFSVARGINNDKGLVVGKTSKPPQPVVPCIWGSPQSPIVLPFIANQNSEDVSFNKVADNGDAAGNYKFIMNGATRHVADLQAALGTHQFVVADINSSHEITGYLPAPPNSGLAFVSAHGFIYNYATHTLVIIPPSSFQGVQMTCGFGLNAGGKAVGASIGTTNEGEYVFFGFLFVGGQRHEMGKCILYDIDDHDLAVGLVPGVEETLWDIPGGDLPNGFPFDSQPIWMDCSNAISTPPPAAHLIPLPPGKPHGVATAINNQGMVVGKCWAGGGSGNSAFVYKINQTGPAIDLNSLLVPAQPNWQLTAAWDINDAGEIVGTASNGTLTNGFHLKPKP